MAKRKSYDTHGVEKYDRRLHKRLRSRVFSTIFLTAALLIGLCVTIGEVIKYKIMPDKTYTVAYACDGIDAKWLETHPFDITGLPETITTSERTKLVAPEILGYEFDAWKNDDRAFSITNKGIRPSKTKDESETYKLFAVYKIKEFTIKLHLNGGHIGAFDKNHDNHKYNVSDGIASSTYTCVDGVFELPTPKKNDYDFSSQGWKVVGSETYTMHCNAEECVNVELIAEWVKK